MPTEMEFDDRDAPPTPDREDERKKFRPTPLTEPP
jgi:hypothetical protein